MNVRITVFLPLLFLLAVSLPAQAIAEKGGNPSREKGNVVQQDQVPEAVHTKANKDNAKKQSAQTNKNQNADTSIENKGKSRDVSDDTKHQSTKENNSQKGSTSVEKKRKSKGLPDQANEKAKEAVHKKVQHKEKETKSDRSPQKQKGKEKQKEPVSAQDTAPHSREKVQTNNKRQFEKSNVEPASEPNASERPQQDLPSPLPAKKEWELHILQAQQSMKIHVGSANDYKGGSKTKLDFLYGETVRLGVRWKQPFVKRHHIFRNQWVNAPPTPPPKLAPSFLRHV
ncbi:hypothetical protein [Alteribacillus bidgolensis]|uniref:Uncharacterized protein n=1 Tax=Alteribacillus bidgolensis TaxID=930129 RepID=A0A1G8FS06_9BACI|nr:hypothetical protein [Alteribacillus bidgolensis]SDH84914.1 hypothetical protein SAMN05216352_10360 [Alteribacillus bidgolensis]